MAESVVWPGASHTRVCCNRKSYNPVQDSGACVSHYPVALHWAAALVSRAAPALDPSPLVDISLLPSCLCAAHSRGDTSTLPGCDTSACAVGAASRWGRVCQHEDSPQSCRHRRLGERAAHASADALRGERRRSSRLEDTGLASRWGACACAAVHPSACHTTCHTRESHTDNKQTPGVCSGCGAPDSSASYTDEDSRDKDSVPCLQNTLTKIKIVSP